MTLLTEPTRIVLRKDSVAATDTNIREVSLLLHGNGTNGSTVITDSSGSPKPVTAVGNAQISTAQSKFGGASLLFDGNGDYLSIASNAAFDFATGNFTIEAWVKLTSLGADWFIASSSGAGGLFFGRMSIQGWGWGRTAVAWEYTSGVNPVADTWYHVALCRNNTDMRMFIDGTQIGTTQTNSTAYNLSVTSLTIASQNASYYLNGYIDDLRITKGVARYTSNFTPPTAPFPDF